MNTGEVQVVQTNGNGRWLERALLGALITAVIGVAGYYMSNTAARAEAVRADLDEYRRSGDSRLVGLERDVRYIRETVEGIKQALSAPKGRR